MVISSELKSFKVLSNQIQIGINLNEIYKLRKETISEETLLKNVKMLLPGHNIKYNLRNFIIEKWWKQPIIFKALIKILTMLKN